MDSKRKQKLELREVNAIAPATPQYMRWSEVPITFDRFDHPDFEPKPSRYPLVLAPTVNKVRLRRTFIDGCSCLDIIFARTLLELSLSVEDLQPSSSPFHGIIPGRHSYPLGQVTFPITFGTRENYRTERVTLQVADLQFPYQAIRGRPGVAKFIAILYYPYLTLKMPGPNGVLTFRTDIKTAYACNVHSCELAEQQEMELGRDDIRQDAKAAKEAVQASSTSEVPSKKAAKEKFKADQVASKTIPLHETDPSTVTHVGADLGDK